MIDITKKIFCVLILLFLGIAAALFMLNEIVKIFIL